MKRKEFITEEFKVTGLVEGNGNWAGAVKRVDLIATNGKPFGAGIRGKREAMAKLLGDVVGPDAVATVRYFMLSPDGIPRFPIVIDYHPFGRRD